VPSGSIPRSPNGSSTSTAVFNYPNGRLSRNAATPTPPAIVQPSALPPVAPIRTSVNMGKKQSNSASHSRSHSHSQYSASPAMSRSPTEAGNTSHSTSPIMPGPISSFKTPITARSNPGQANSQYNQHALAAANAAVSAAKPSTNLKSQAANVNSNGVKFQQSQTTSPAIVQTSALPPSTSPPPTKDLPIPPGVDAALVGKEVPVKPGTAGRPADTNEKAGMI